MLKYKFGLTPEDYKGLLDKQDGVCGICGGLNRGKWRDHNMSVDHCHVSGKIRGILCANCNTKLGWYEANEPLIWEYLMKADAIV